MKKILLVLVGILLLTGCENAKLNSNNNNNNTESSQYDSEYYEIIGVDKFKEVYASEEATIIYFGSSECSYCLTFKENAKQFAKENEIKVYFVQLDASAGFTDKDAEELYAIVEFEYIPYITVFKNKEMLYGESNVLSVSELKDLANEHGVTK